MKQCPACKKELHDSATHCDPCGCRVNGHRYRPLLLGIATIIILALLAISYKFLPTRYIANPLTKTVDSQLEALRTGDIDKAYAYLANETTASVSLHKFQSYITSYPMLKRNQGASYTDSKIMDNKGYVRGTLKNSDNKHIAIEYLFVKENDQWKISAMHIKEAISDTLPENTSPIYLHNHYTITYPAGWTYDDSNKASITFSGKEETPSAYSTVTVQVLLSSQNGGDYKNTREVMDDLQNQISKQAQNVKFIDAGTIELPTDPRNVHGNFFIATYNYKEHAMKKMQFVLGDEKGKFFYSWSFTATAEQFDKDLPIARAMFESWKLGD